MYLFGDLSNLFFNHNISRELFQTVRMTYNTTFSPFAFNDSEVADALITTPLEALQSLTVTPSSVSTEMDLLTLSVLAVNAAGGNITSSDIVNQNCLIITYANESIDNLTTPFQVLQEIVSNPDYTLRVTTQTCDCVQSEFNDYNSLVRCYSDETFLFGLGGVDGILWIMYLFAIIAVVVFILALIQVSLIQLACERQIHKIRLRYYKSVLRQDISWFDLNSTGELASVLNE